MKCSKCGGEIPAESRFCLSCGEIVSEGPRQTPAAQPPKKHTALWAGLAGLVLVAVVVVIALSMRGSRVAEVSPVPAPQQAPVVNVPGMPSAPQPSVLDTDVEKPPLDLKKDEKPEPPAEVIAYLEHLKKVESTRMELKKRQEAALYTMIVNSSLAPIKDMLRMLDSEEAVDDAPATYQQALQQTAQLASEWNQLTSFFLSKRPPEQCHALAGKYYEALGSVISAMNSIQEIIVQQDVGRAKQMSATGESSAIDEKIEAADRELAALCRMYGIRKPFTILSDRGATGITSPPSIQ